MLTQRVEAFSVSHTSPTVSRLVVYKNVKGTEPIKAGQEGSRGDILSDSIYLPK